MSSENSNKVNILPHEATVSILYSVICLYLFIWLFQTNDPDGPKKDLSDVCLHCCLLIFAFLLFTFCQFLPKDSGNKSDLLGRPPHIPNEDQIHNLEKPLDKSDLQSRVKELNK